MSAWHERPLADLRRALDTGETTAVALADHFLGRIATSTLNAFIDVRPDATLEAARSADERLARGERAPLHHAALRPRAAAGARAPASAGGLQHRWRRVG